MCFCARTCACVQTQAHGGRPSIRAHARGMNTQVQYAQTQPNAYRSQSPQTPNELRVKAMGLMGRQNPSQYKTCAHTQARRTVHAHSHTRTHTHTHTHTFSDAHAHTHTQAESRARTHVCTHSHHLILTNSSPPPPPPPNPPHLFLSPGAHRHTPHRHPMSCA